MENKKVISNKVKIVIAVIAIAIVGILACGKLFSDKSAGKITVSVVALDGTTIKEKSIKYTETDTLTGLVEKNFENVTITDGFLYTIETLTTPDDWSTFICLYTDGEMSAVGINEVVLHDGLAVSFVDTVMSW